MGLNLAIEEIGEDVAMIAIDILSVLQFLKKRISEQMTYKKFYIEIDFDEGLFNVYLWRGEVPKWLLMKMK